jgi:asparagine synthetase B (glutamine-hydrolysing)
MCGIVAIWYDEIERLKQACDIMVHRGPHDHDLYFDQFANIALGHQRVSILEFFDLGHQSNQRNMFPKL